MSLPLSVADPDIYQAVQHELERQNSRLELIASENFTSEAILEATGSVFTNKYAEGYPGKRYYGGCEFADVVENLARDRAKKLFRGRTRQRPAALGFTGQSSRLRRRAPARRHHPRHESGARRPPDARPSAEFFGQDLPGRRLRRAHGTTSGSTTTKLARLAEEHKPKMIIAGAQRLLRASSISRASAKIADSVGALLLVDMAHFSGLVAAGLYPNPCEYADIVTSTTHKTLRGPRSGMILCRAQYAAAIDKTVFPGTQGGPLVHIIAAKAVCFLEAKRPEFAVYQRQVIANAQALAASLAERGFRIVSGGTDTHLLLVDVFAKGVRGGEAETASTTPGSPPTRTPSHSM